MPNTHNARAEQTQILEVHTLARNPSVTRAAAAKRSKVDQIARLPWARHLSRLLDSAQQDGAIQSYAWAPGTRRCIFEMRLSIATVAGPVCGILECVRGARATLIFTGCLEALTLTGLFDAAWFPGQPGQSRTLGNARDVEILGQRRKEVVIRLLRVHGCKANFGLSKDECSQIEMIVWGGSSEALKTSPGIRKVVSLAEYRAKKTSELPPTIHIKLLPDGEVEYEMERVMAHHAFDVMVGCYVVMGKAMQIIRDQLGE